MRRNIILALLLIGTLVVGGVMYFVALPRDESPEPGESQVVESDEASAPSLTYRLAAVTAGTRTYQLQVAETPEQQSRGLGERKTLGGDGMIFPYSKPQKLCFWMKDMHFAIDMIWLDGDKRVLKVQPDVSPDTYPRTTYCQQGAQYVVELDAGQAQKSSITVGSALNVAL